MNQAEEKKGEKKSKWFASTENGNIVSVAFLILLLISIILAFLGPFSIGKLCISAFWIGSILALFGYYHLVYVLPKISKDIETRISMEALRASFWLVIFGLVVIVVSLVLGFLFLIGY